MNVRFEGARGECIDAPDINFLRDIVLNPGCDYWSHGITSGAVLEIHDSEAMRCLLINPRESLGVYLKYHEFHNHRLTDTQLSMHDPTKLSKVVDGGDEWFASVGLFLPPHLAWPGVEYFCQTGRLTPQIHWISPSTMPEDGNY